MIRSAGDLEVVLLHENHSLLADLISDSYYKLVGSPPSEVRFHSAPAFKDFFVHANELFSDGRTNAVLDDEHRSFSLLSAASWFCRSHASEAERCGLAQAVATLEEWVSANRRIRFWCGGLDSHITLSLSRRRMINFVANMNKHSLLRLGVAMEQLQKICTDDGVAINGLDVVAVREEFLGELESRLNYLSSWLVELLGAYFLALNALVIQRYEENPTNRVQQMRIPAGVTSPAICDLYGSVLVFQRYDPARIERFVPSVPGLLKRRY
jgi:hypothetical protein